ncbi:MAG TPA: hypothetical protein V6D50_01360 [Chroococcales cyanobacterium]
MYKYDWGQAEAYNWEKFRRSQHHFKSNVTDLSINQPLRGGVGGDACPPLGVWGNPQVRVFSNTCNFHLKSVPFILSRSPKQRSHS